MNDAIILLILAAVKSAVNEVLFWSQDKTTEEIEARVREEEQRTGSLMGRMSGGGIIPPGPKDP